MSNKYCNLPGGEKISETFGQINDGFASVETDKDELQSQINNHIDSNSAHNAENITFESERTTLFGIDDTKEAIEKIDQRVDELVNNPDPNKDLELVDLRNSNIYGVFPTAKARSDNTDNLFSSHLADDVKHFITSTEYPDIQQAMDYVGQNDKGELKLPPGIHNVNTKLLWNYDDIMIVGPGEGVCELHFTGIGTAIESSNKTTGERYRCGFKNVKVSSIDDTPNTPVIDMQGCRNFNNDHLWASGGGSNCDIVRIKGIYGVADATYNRFKDCYLGAGKNGIISEEVANNNIFDNVRIQVPGISHWFKGATYKPNSNQIIGGACEYPGTVGTGVKVETGCDGIEILGTRFEGLADGIIIDSGAVNPSVIAPYFSSNNRNLTYEGVTYPNAQVFKGILIKGGTTIGFTKALLSPALDPASVPVGGDNYFYDVVDLYHLFRSYRDQAGLRMQYSSGGNYVPGMEMFANATQAWLKAWSDRVIQWGTGSPEGVVIANVGSLFLRTDGGASTTLYVKQSGTGNTGWVAK